MFIKLINFINKIIILVVTCTIFGCAALGYLFYYYSKDLPDHRQLEEYSPPIVTRLYAADGKLLEEYATEHRIFVPINVVPKKLINAFIAVEDKNFYQHKGVDIGSILRAVIQNVNNISDNKSLIGGSTITQQVVKNFLLTNERSLSRKIKEAILSFRISQVYSKDRIMELYLNQIYLGGRSYGIASAALNYFNKSIDELGLEEIAYIAALPKAPSNYDLKRNYDKAKIRRDYVIDRMIEEKYVSVEEAEHAKKLPITLHKRDITEVAKAEFFAESTRKEIAARYSSKILYEGGLSVRTTLDPNLQQMADIAFRKGLIKYDQRHGYRGPFINVKMSDNFVNDISHISIKYALEPWFGAMITKVNKDNIKIILENKSESTINIKDFSWAKSNLKSPAEIFKVGDIIAVEKIETGNKVNYSLRQIPEVSGGLIAMDPYTGRILALVGGFNYLKSEFNRAFQAKRQPGSVYKPFVYLAALENGLSPASIIIDGPIELSQGAGLPTWKPKNYSNDYLGPTTLRRGLEKSRNTMTVRLAQIVGIKKLMEITKRFGIDDNPKRNFSLALGAAETTLVNMTNAFSILINGGKKVTPSLIEKIQDRNGTTIYKRDERKCDGCVINSKTDVYSIITPQIEDTQEQIIDPRTAYQMVSILQGVVERGTAQYAKSLGKTLGGKTGTTNNSMDAWFIGFTPDIVVGTYVGYDQPKSLGEKETGASVALPIFTDFMEKYLKDKPDIPFRIPKGIKMVKIDAYNGEPTSAALGKEVIYEAFKSGSASNPATIIPSDEEIILAPGLINPQDLEQDFDEPVGIINNIPNTGTGGMY
jgi:penicillin-binding protein 1A